MDTFTRQLNRFVRWTGERLKWLTLLLVLLIFADVLLRYAFSVSKAWITDLEWHFFALLFLLGAAYSLQADQHVRVDVFYSKWSVKKKAWIDLLGTAFFLIPWCLLIIWTSFTYAEHAFALGERSPEPGGLPMRWLIKGAITLGFFILLLQAISMVIQSLQTIRAKSTSA